MKTRFYLKQFVIISLIVSIWINASEVFRYFVIVMPETREYLQMVPNVAAMDLGIFAIWGLWDTLLTLSVVFTFWLVANAFGNHLRSVFLAGTAFWVFFFVLFWLGQFNMGLSEPGLLLVVLPLAWLEMVVACFIASRLYARDAFARTDA